MDSLSQAARWRLPAQEAEEVIADYQELLAERPRTEEELYRDLGDPVQAVWLLVQPKAYWRWKVVFAVLSACLLLPAISPQPGMYFLWRMFTQHYTSASRFAGTLVLGLIVSFVWFRREKGPGKAFPQKMFIPLFLLLAAIAGVWYLACLTMFHPEGLVRLTEQHGDGWLSYVPQAGQTIGVMLERGVLLAALAGEFGLWKARVDGRRWQAVYMLSLTLVTLAVSLLALLTRMTLDISVETWYLPWLRQFLLVTVAGLVGTGVSLC